MKRKYKVLQLLLHCNDNISGVADEIAQGFPENRFEVTTAFLCDGPDPVLKESQLSRTVKFNFRPSDLKGVKRYKALKVLYRHCRDQQYDVIIAHRFKPMNLLMLLNHFLDIPACIGVQHGIGDFDRFIRRYEAKILMKRNWKTVGVSRAVCDYLIGCRSGFQHRNTVKINNAIDIQRAEGVQLSRGNARAELNVPLDSVILGAIGRLVPVKGHMLLIKALSKLQVSFPHVHVAIIGEGRSRHELEAEIDRHGLHGRVHLLGHHDNAIKYVKAFDVFVMPSLSEGFPLALLEGMSGHLPVVGSDIESLRPILEGFVGRLFKAGCVDSLAETLKNLLHCSEKQRQEEGERAYAHLCAVYDIADYRNQYRDLVEEMLSKGHLL